ncbi:hypothetical protein AAFF_G00213740 [Aldrovandia affinis]|uniref:Integrase catalytic domain-containing protein n=1 Tax=Aldrovandia affinis TaxID=143900 RepID=A0AAD7RGJ1_9TELE|nr:hypothetical protein AAFF_G00213740 [Aldrovandia affinis]
MATNSSTEEQLVHAVSNTGRFAKYAKPQPNSTRVAIQEEWRTRACRNCGRLHKPRQCPAYNVDCRKCGKKNHFAAVCRSNPDVALVEAEAPDVNTLYIAGITRAHKKNSRDTGWSTSLRVGGTLVTFKLDTGAEANVLPLAVAEGLPMPLNMQRTDTVLVAYGEDVQGKLAGKTIFTILDEKDGYYQIKLDDESADLCTFNMPWGRFFNPKEEIVIQADASKDGLGACLMQNEQPVAYASRALSRAEQNYAQIEKKLLAIVFALKKFHQYIYGAEVRVQSNHEPLEAIISKPIGQAPARLQRMLLQIQKYDIHISYTPGTDMLIADTLSRAHPLTGSSEEGDLGDEKVIYAATTDPPHGGSITQLVQAASETDEEMLLLKDLHTGGWPDRRKSVPPRAQPYWPEQLPSNQREPLLPHPVPDAPWQRITADIFELHGRPFLLITDYYSKFPEVLQLPDKTASSVIARFKAVFPFTLIADHMPFASAEMARFASKWGFEIIHSSPAFSQSNGMAERAIKTVKAMLTAAARNGVDPHLAKLNLRNTPVTVNVQEGLAHCQWRQKESYDKTAAPLLPFRTGERVRMETAQGWQPASIVRAREEPRSYDIITPSGATYRRNRKHLRPDRAARHDDQQDDIDAPDSDTEQGATPVEAPEPGANAPESQSAPCTRSGRRIKPSVRLKDYDTASD